MAAVDIANREILCIVTGMEHSGTTHLSKILSAHPEIMSGFECGLLLSTIKDFQKMSPWYQWMQESTDKGQWGILPENMEKICKAETYYDAYSVIKKYSGDIGTKKIKEHFQNATYILDKTPRYVFYLDTIMAKVSVPFLVIQKDIVSQYKSYKKRGYSFLFFITQYLYYSSSMKKALKKYPDRVMIINHHQLLKDSVSVLKRIYSFLDIQYYPNSTMEGFFAKTGLKKNRFYNQSGGWREDPSEKELAVQVTKTEIKTLKLIAALKKNWIGVKIINLAIAIARFLSKKRR